jgi:hypothetical protein
LRREQDLEVRISDIADDDEEMTDDVERIYENYLRDADTGGDSETVEDE